MNRRRFVRATATVGGAALTGLGAADAAQGPAEAPASDRASWVARVDRVFTPVLGALAAGRLRQTMPVESSGTGRADVTHLEAVGRTLMGLAPWLDLPASGDAAEEVEPKPTRSSKTRQRPLLDLSPSA